ncbi:MAG: hypothetical protein R3C59_00250 [Planctomycetaceae bacterium]
MNATRDRKLGQTELSVLRLTNQFGLCVPQATGGLPELGGLSAVSQQRLLDRLVRWQLLTPCWLYPGRRCYVLTLAGQQRVSGAGQRGLQVDRPLSSETKLRRFAMLSFCCLGKTPRRPVTPCHEDETRLQADDAPLSGNYYVQNGDKDIYGFLRVDMGGAGRWDRIVAKCCHDARRIVTASTLKPYTASGLFEITLATATQQKAERIHQAFCDNPTELPVRIAIIPELFHLQAPRPI